MNVCDHEGLRGCPPILPIDESPNSVRAVQINALTTRRIDNFTFDYEGEISIARRHVHREIGSLLDMSSIKANALSTPYDASYDL
jgi:hypothetical protein